MNKKEKGIGRPGRCLMPKGEFPQEQPVKKRGVQSKSTEKDGCTNEFQIGGVSSIGSGVEWEFPTVSNE